MESIQLNPAYCRYGSNLVTVFDRPTFSTAEGAGRGFVYYSEFWKVRFQRVRKHDIEKTCFAVLAGSPAIG